MRCAPCGGPRTRRAAFGRALTFWLALVLSLTGGLGIGPSGRLGVSDAWGAPPKPERGGAADVGDPATENRAGTEGSPEEAAPPVGHGSPESDQAKDLLGRLHDAESALRAGDAERAAAMARAVRGEPDLAHDVLVDATRIHALALSVLGRKDEARAEFVALLAYAPAFQADPVWGPTVLAPYFAARAHWREQPVQPGLDVRATLPHAGPKMLELLLRDPTEVVRNVHVAWRWEAEPSFRTTAVMPMPQNTVTVGDPPRAAATGPREASMGAATEGPRLLFFARATDELGRVVFEVGREADPRSTHISHPPASVEAVDATPKKSF
jgi:hypothetical protein